MLFKAVIWGVAENRQFHDQGVNKKRWLGHLSTYHGWMFIFFANLNVGYTNVFPLPWYVQLVIFIFLMVWDILILDVTWWIIRFLDITYLGKTWRIKNASSDIDIVVWRFPTVNYYDHGKGLRWHSDGDWDAAGFGQYRLGMLHCYKWWIWSAAALTVLGVVIFAFI